MTDQMAGGVQERALFNGSSGRWATEQMLKALKAGQNFDSSVLRTLDTLRHEEWQFFDRELLAEALISLHGVSDLIGAGLTQPIPNSLGKTMFAYEKLGFMGPAGVSLDGVTRTDNDRQEVEMGQVPLPVIHKDFKINLRTLTASRTNGEGLDTTQIRTAGRVVSEMAEQMLFQGGKTFGGVPIYGYMTEPNRNLASYGAGGDWALTTKTGAEYVADVLTMVRALETDRFYGPYWIYLPRSVSPNLDNDFKAFGGETIRQRLMKINGVQRITTVDQLPTGNAIMVNATSDVTKWLSGEPLQTVQWDTLGGFVVEFKAWMIGAPLVRSDISGRSGIVHMS